MALLNLFCIVLNSEAVLGIVFAQRQALQKIASKCGATRGTALNLGHALSNSSSQITSSKLESNCSTMILTRFAASQIFPCMCGFPLGFCQIPTTC